MPIDSVIFDVEGTLIDCVSDVLDSWHYTLGERGYPVSRQDLQRLSGMDGSDMLDRLLPHVAKAEKKKLLHAQGTLYRRKYLPRTRPFAGVRESFVALRQRGYRLGIATTCAGDELRAYDASMHVLELTDAVSCGDEGSKGKPHPDLFYETLRKLGIVEAGRVLAVGDTPFDALAAKPLGMVVLGVLTGGFSQQELLEAGCDAVLAKVDDLPGHLQAYGRC
jgi:phosphoglycolate phosphatase-like HAD superfamily hydrolase